MKTTSEAAFETAIKSALLANGYTELSSEQFNRERAVTPYIRASS